MSFDVPTKVELKNMLGMLYNGLEVEDCESFDLNASELIFGLYLDDEDNPVTLLVSDLSFGANMSSALTMLPAPVAQDAIKNGKLEDMMISNLNEIANILSKLFMLDTSHHLRFTTLHLASDGLPETVSGLLEKISTQVFFQATPSGYGAGKVGFLVP